LSMSTLTGVSGTAFQNNLNLPTYILPASNDLTVIIPSLSTKETTSRQIISTPPIERIIPGQTMIMPVQFSEIPNFGGVAKVQLSSKSSVLSTGVFDKDWIMIETTNTMPNTKPLLSDDRLLALFVDITYRYEEEGKGFDWGDETNFSSPPKLTLLVPIPTESDVVKLSNGCGDVTIQTQNGMIWVSTIDTVISNILSSKVGFCEVVIQSDHYSSKNVSFTKTSSLVSPSPTVSSSSGGGGRIGIKTNPIESEYFQHITENNAENNTRFPQWMKFVMQWWLDKKISDIETINAVQYLMQKNIITNNEERKSSFKITELKESTKMITKLWLENKISDSSFNAFWFKN
ncbi:MAG: hypothetical protein ACE5RF_09095, partial [Nitrosarchaeum sp.]